MRSITCSSHTTNTILIFILQEIKETIVIITLLMSSQNTNEDVYVCVCVCVCVCVRNEIWSILPNLQYSFGHVGRDQLFIDMHLVFHLELHIFMHK